MSGQEKTRFDTETEEFFEKYPDEDIDGIPERVWESVKKGRNLSAAYAEYAEEKKKAEAEAELINEQNAANSSGRIGERPARAVYTAKEVASMSADMIKANYDDIIESMKAKGFYA